MKTLFPWYSESRLGGWFVKLGSEQHFLGKHPGDAPKPKRGRDGRWKPPQVILDQFYNLMAIRDTASKSDYTFETVCALFQEELGDKDPDLPKRYEQTLSHFRKFEYRGRKAGKLLVNAELEGVHLEMWAATFPSTQTQRTYINCCKAVLTWAVNKKGVNISHNRQGRDLPGQRLPRFCEPPRSCPGRFPPLPAKGVDQGPQAHGRGRRAPGGPLRHPARTGPLHARPPRRSVAAPLGGRRR